MKSSWCKSSPVKAVAGRPVTSVAIRRATGGCEAYTVSKQVAMIQPRNRPNCDADAVLRAEGSIRHTDRRGVAGIAGVASTGHAYQGTFRGPRRAPCFSVIWAPGGAQPRDTWSRRGEGCPREKRMTLERSLLRPRATGGAGTGRRAVLRIHTANAQRETAGPLPVLRPPDELSQSGEVRPCGAPHLASVAGTQDAGKVPPLAALHSSPCALSLVAPAHHARLASFVSRA